MADADQRAIECRLLALPAELRNRIYRHALVKDHLISIQKHVELPLPPGLLQVNRQIRAEAYQIYYLENNFGFTIRDYDASTLIRWCKVFTSIEHQKRCMLNIAPSTNFDNLLVWLRVFFERKCGGIEVGKPGEGNRNVEAAASLFEMTARMQQIKGMSWSEVKELLEAARQGFAALDPAWAA